MKFVISVMLLLLGGCAAVRPAGQHPDRLDGYFGTYVGSFDSALTEDADDDLNYNPCNPDETDCFNHHAPLADIVLTLERRNRNRVYLNFYRTLADRDAGRPLDLLGAGCGTRLGALESVTGDDGTTTARFPLTTDNALCLGKLRPTSRHHVLVSLLGSNTTADRRLQVEIDRRVTDANYLYVKEDGVERRVKIDPDNTVREGFSARYRVCIENDLGEFERCVLTDRRFRSFVLPVPLPGGVAVNYTFWQELSPRLRRTQGRFEVDRYRAIFEPVEP